jgi:DNA-binding SARP family transcriptional activator
MITPATLLKPVLSKYKGVSLGIWGEAGVGKSYQVTRLLQDLSCRSASFHATTPLATLATLPRPKKLATWAERTLERVAKNEAVETTGILNALGVTLAGLAPFVLHLEDIHEADEERFSFIRELATVISRVKGVGLIVTSRREPPESFTNIKLEPLSQLESDNLLETDRNATLPKEALAGIYSKAAGNPLYTLEYLRYLTRQGFLWNDGRMWHWRKPEHTTMPVTVEALIEQLVSRAKTEPLQKYVLESKAFLPLQASDELWAKVARVDEQTLEHAITELSQQGIFKARDFAHPLFREVMLKTLSTERKQHLARRAISVLEHEPAQAALFVEDAKLESEKTLEILKQAATHLKEHDEVAAAKFLARAVDFAKGEERAMLTFEATETLKYKDVPLSIRLFERLLEEQPHQTEALYLMSLIYAREMQEEKAEQVFSRLPLHEQQSPRGIETLLQMKYALYKSRDILDIWEKNQDLQPKLNPSVIAPVVFALNEELQIEEAILLAKQTLARSDLSVWPRVVLTNVLGTAYYNSFRYEASEATYTELIRLMSEELNGKRLSSGYYNRGLTRQRLQNYKGAMSDAAESYRLGSEAGDSMEIARSLRLLGDLSIELGDYENAENYLHSSLHLLNQRHAVRFLCGTENGLALLYRSWSTPQSGLLTLKYAYAFLNHAKELDDSDLIEVGYISAAFSEAMFGNANKALELAEEAFQRISVESVAPYSANWAKATALRALNRLSEARVLFQQVYKEAQVATQELDTQLIGLELDRLNNDLAGARTRMQWFEERGLMNGVNIAKRYFPELADTKILVAGATSDVRLEVLGTLQVRGDKPTPIRGRKRQELLALLLETRISGRSEVSRLTVFDILYPDEDELKAGVSLKSLIRSLRETLGNNAITTTNNGYALGECSSDAELFLQTLDTTLWRGPYLADLAFEDSTVKDLLYLSLFEKTKTSLETSPREVARVGSILVEADPYNTDYLKTYLTALRLSKHHGKLTRHYQEAKHRLLEVGETLPETWQKFLA